MDDRALTFSQAGDRAFARVADRFPEAEKRRLSIAQALASSRFEALRLATHNYIAACLKRPGSIGEPELLRLLVDERDQLHNHSPGGMLLPKREHALEWNLLHKSVAAAFGDFGIGDCIDGIDLPVNVRLVYGQTSGARAAAYSSSKLHVDVWAGVPTDAVVVVLPVLGDIDDITIVFGEMQRERELAWMRALDDYDQGNEVRMATPYRDCVLQHGWMYLADVRLLHQTVRRRKEGVRVSIDFRFRLNDPVYRALAPAVVGPESVDTRVPYQRWLRVGSTEMIVFDETMEQARERRPQQSSLPVYDGPYRLVDLFASEAA